MTLGCLIGSFVGTLVVGWCCYQQGRRIGERDEARRLLRELEAIREGER